MRISCLKNLQFPRTSAGEDFVMESFTLAFSENVRGPICNNITILDDDTYEFIENLIINLNTSDASVILNSTNSFIIIHDEDSKIS